MSKIKILFEVLRQQFLILSLGTAVEWTVRNGHSISGFMSGFKKANNHSAYLRGQHILQGFWCFERYKSIAINICDIEGGGYRSIHECNTYRFLLQQTFILLLERTATVQRPSSDMHLTCEKVSSHLGNILNHRRWMPSLIAVTLQIAVTIYDVSGISTYID